MTVIVYPTLSWSYKNRVPVFTFIIVSNSKKGSWCIWHPNTDVDLPNQTPVDICPVMNGGHFKDDSHFNWLYLFILSLGFTKLSIVSIGWEDSTGSTRLQVIIRKRYYTHEKHNRGWEPLELIQFQCDILESEAIVLCSNYNNLSIRSSLFLIFNILSSWVQSKSTKPTKRIVSTAIRIYNRITVAWFKDGRFLSNGETRSPTTYEWSIFIPKVRGAINSVALIHTGGNDDRL